LLHTEPEVLLHKGPGVWVERRGCPVPTRQAEGGFRFCTWEATFWKPRRVPS